MPTAVALDNTRNSIAVEATRNSVVVETFDVWTDYYFLQAFQVLPEHKEAGS